MEGCDGMPGRFRVLMIMISAVAGCVTMVGCGSQPPRRGGETKSPAPVYRATMAPVKTLTANEDTQYPSVSWTTDGTAQDSTTVIVRIKGCLHVVGAEVEPTKSSITIAIRVDPSAAHPGCPDGSHSLVSVELGSPLGTRKLEHAPVSEQR